MTSPAFPSGAKASATHRSPRTQNSSCRWPCSSARRTSPTSRSTPRPPPEERILVECKNTQEFDLKEAAAFRRAIKELEPVLAEFQSEEFRLDVVLSRALKGNPDAQRRVLRDRLADPFAHHYTPATLLIADGLSVVVADRETRPAYGHAHRMGSFRGGPVSRAVNVATSADFDVNWFGYTHEGALRRKYSVLLNEAARQTAPEPALLVLRCSHPAFAFDVADAKLDLPAFVHVPGIWINPFDRGRVFYRTRDYPTVARILSLNPPPKAG